MPLSDAPATQKKLLTAEEFCDFVQRPENSNKWFELDRGEVIELPPPQNPHCRATANITFELELFVRCRRFGYVLSNDAGVILARDPDTVRGPDVALYEDANHARDLHPKYGENPPVLAVEVLSPTDPYKKVMRKVQDYLKNGVKVVWLVDPEEQTLTVYRPGGRSSEVAPDQEVAGDPELPGLRCRVVDFFLLPGDMPPLTP